MDNKKEKSIKRAFQNWMPQTAVIMCFIAMASIFNACVDENVTSPKNKKTETIQGLSSLEGTVWVHRADTDPNSLNWFSHLHNPNYFPEGNKLDLSYPVEISFLENGIIYEPANNKLTDGFTPQYYEYSYSEPYITIVMNMDGLFPGNRQSVAEWQKKYNLCTTLTIDDNKCDPIKCKHNYREFCASSGLGYWFLGKVEGDIMHLQQIMIGNNPNKPNDYGKVHIHRDIYLVRKK